MRNAMIVVLVLGLASVCFAESVVVRVREMRAPAEGDLQPAQAAGEARQLVERTSVETLAVLGEAFSVKTKTSGREIALSGRVEREADGVHRVRFTLQTREGEGQAIQNVSSELRVGKEEAAIAGVQGEARWMLAVEEPEEKE